MQTVKVNVRDSRDEGCVGIGRGFNEMWAV